MKQTLWSKNYILMITGTFLSALGGVGLNIAFGLVIFDNTQSTLMSGIFTAITMIPHIIFPLIVGPYIDRNDPLKVLLKNEKLLILIFLFAGVFVQYNGFSYLAYLFIVLVISLFGIVSDTASQSISAQIIAKENYSRGFAFMSTIYPLCQVIVTPIALFLYKNYGLATLFYIYTLLSTLDVIIESQIKYNFEYNTDPTVHKFSLFNDLKEGYTYLHNDRQLMSVLIFFSIVMFTNAWSNLWYPFFVRSETLTLYDFGVISALSSAGYMFGGFIHSFIVIKDKYRYTVAVFVYFIFVIFDSLFLFMPFMAMCVIRFILGLAGMNSANIRTTAIQQHLEPKHRAKVNSFFSISFSISMMLGQLVIGYLGDIFAYEKVAIFCQILYLLSIIFIVLVPKNKIKELYNYSTV